MQVKIGYNKLFVITVLFKTRTMKLKCSCLYCHAENILPFVYSDRAVMSRNIGNIISFTCSNCNKLCVLSPNEVRAKESSLSKVVFTISLFLGGFGSWWLVDKYLSKDYIVAVVMVVALSLSFSTIVAILFALSERRSVSLFNKYYV